MGRRSGRHAVVIGASMAGLLAARVLADAFDRVTVFDRDVLTEDGAPRKGVPQGRQIHALQPRGQEILEDLFPGFTREIGAAGAKIQDTVADGRWYFNGRRLLGAPSGLVTVSASRPFLEAQVRRRVRALPAVTVVDRCDVLGLRTTETRDRVTGVRVLRADVEQDVDADVVVDASGRGSRISGWLRELGYPTVEEERWKIGVGYTTRLYRLRPGAEIDDGAIIVVASRALPRGAIFAKAEHDLLILSANGILGDHPPVDPEGFDDFVRSLPVPDVQKAILDAEPIGDPVPYRFPVSLRRRYERMARFPDGLLVTGDSVCSFNPVYAQGMTVAALGAVTIRRHLRSGRLAPRRFLRELAREAIDESWDAMRLNDLAFEGVEGRRSLRHRLTSAYVTRVQAAATRDVVVSLALIRVLSLVEKGSSLLRPAVLRRVLRRPRAARGEAGSGHAGAW